jgi:hypothetical protein
MEKFVTAAVDVPKPMRATPEKSDERDDSRLQKSPDYAAGTRRVGGAFPIAAFMNGTAAAYLWLASSHAYVSSLSILRSGLRRTQTH